MTQRVYRYGRRCPHCGSNRTLKGGRFRGKQTYRCGQCRYRFTPDGNRSYYTEATRAMAVQTYVEGVSLSVISRTLGVKVGTVYSWLKKPGRPGLSCGMPASGARRGGQPMAARGAALGE